MMATGLPWTCPGTVHGCAVGNTWLVYASTQPPQKKHIHILLYLYIYNMCDTWFIYIYRERELYIYIYMCFTCQCPLLPGLRKFSQQQALSALSPSIAISNRLLSLVVSLQSDVVSASSLSCPRLQPSPSYGCPRANFPWRSPSTSRLHGLTSARRSPIIDVNHRF